MPLPPGSRQPLGTRAVSLYRLYGFDGTLLYVGVTGVGLRRFFEHGKEKAWWAEVCDITVEHYATRAGALAAETKAIGHERPRHNVVGVRRSA